MGPRITQRGWKRIRHAQDKVYFENYFIVEDRTGAEFAEALAERARAGVRVRLIYDWVGSLGKASRSSGAGSAMRASKCAASTGCALQAPSMCCIAIIARCSRLIAEWAS